MRTIEGLRGVDDLQPDEHLGHSPWVEIDQARVDRFADATDDRQWIHVDAERAEAGPFGRTIAHGYLTLSLIPHLTAGIYEFRDVAMVINYGLDRVRFLEPVLVGSSVRASTRVRGVDVRPDDSRRLLLETTVELRGARRPACVASTIAFVRA